VLGTASLGSTPSAARPSSPVNGGAATPAGGQANLFSGAAPSPAPKAPKTVLAKEVREPAAAPAQDDLTAFLADIAVKEGIPATPLTKPTQTSSMCVDLPTPTPSFGTRPSALSINTPAHQNTASFNINPGGVNVTPGAWQAAAGSGALYGGGVSNVSERSVMELENATNAGLLGAQLAMTTARLNHYEQQNHTLLKELSDTRRTADELLGEQRARSEAVHADEVRRLRHDLEMQKMTLVREEEAHREKTRGLIEKLKLAEQEAQSARRAGAQQAMQEVDERLQHQTRMHEATLANLALTHAREVETLKQLHEIEVSSLRSQTTDSMYLKGLAQRVDSSTSSLAALHQKVTHARNSALVAPLTSQSCQGERAAGCIGGSNPARA
jgi:hypothetical protein